MKHFTKILLLMGVVLMLFLTVPLAAAQDEFDQIYIRIPGQ